MDNFPGKSNLPKLTPADLGILLSLLSTEIDKLGCSSLSIVNSIKVKHCKRILKLYIGTEGNPKEVVAN